MFTVILIAVVSSTYAQTDSAIREVTELIYSSDEATNAPAPGKDVEVNTAGPRLFAYVNESKLYVRPTYAKFLRLIDNYVYLLGTADRCDHCLQEEEEFLNAVLNTTTFRTAWSFLHTHGLASSHFSEFKLELRSYWFRRYSRSEGAPADSSGFEHVFVGEASDNRVRGFHNWIQFYEQEKGKLLQYRNRITQCEPNVLTITFDWNRYNKPIGGHFMNTSPEFDLAIFTVCYLARTNQDCNITLNGQPITVKTVSRDGTSVATSYPTCPSSRSEKQ